jgi:hypothetical protein
VEYEEVKNRVNAEISEDDYVCFIRPYENKKRLERIRAMEGESNEQAVSHTHPAAQLNH